MEEYDFLREYDEHSDVFEFVNEEVGLRGYIAIHRKRGKLSTGGTRFFDYASDHDALRDVLRLSAAMTSKCVVAGLPYGGGKAVIIGDPKKIKSEALLIAYAEIISMLQGAFFTGEDVGMTEEDVQVLIEHSPFFNGKTGFAGDPSPYAARSVFTVMKKAAELYLHTSTLEGEKIAVKGLGKVGGALLHLLDDEKVILSGADISETAIQTALTSHPQMTIITPKEITFSECLIFAPCAFGREIRLDSFDRIKARMICGGANNQLESSSLATQLMKRGILYVPDYLANAGGLINVSEELEGDGYHPERVTARIEHLVSILEDSYLNAEKKGISLSDSVDDYVVSQLGV